MSEVEIISRIEQLEQQYDQLRKDLEELQLQLVQKSADAASKTDSERPWIEG